MFIYKITNTTQQAIRKGAKCIAQIDKRGRLVQDEFKRLTNNLIEGIPTYINGVEVKASASPMPKCSYTSVQITRREQVPEELKKAEGETFLDKVIAYNQSIKQRVDAYIKRRTAYIQDLDVRNQYYKDIMMICLKQHIKGYSPCAKTYWEAKAQYDFEGSIPDDCEITDEQIAYVECNARKFGLEIPNNDFYIASREAFYNIVDDSSGYPIVVGQKSHGFTEEIHRVIHTRPNYSESRFGERIKRDRKSMQNALHPNNLPEEWLVQSMETTKGQYMEVYKQLQYIESLDPETRDFFIADGYCRCPHCGEITRKVNDGVRVFCEYCNEELEEFVTCSNDHLLYGTDIDQSYSNLDDVQDFADDQMRTAEEDEEEDYE
jgi:hypothetical protein